MEISKGLWWGLAATIFIALVIMLVAFFWSRFRAKKIKHEYLDKATKNKTSKALERENHGILLWDEKEKVDNPLDDTSLEFIINTVFRNSYKTFKTVGTSEYEKKTLTQLGESKFSDKEFSFLLSMDTKDPISVFEKEFKNLKQGGMMIFANMPKRKKITKDMFYHFKINNIKWDYEKYGKGLILVVK